MTAHRQYSEGDSRETTRKVWPQTALESAMTSTYVSGMPKMFDGIATPPSDGTSSRNDKLVLATVNAPYKRSINSDELAKCIAKAQMAEWPSHIVSFFTEVRAEIVLRFADEHGISKHDLASAYQVMKTFSGDYNSDLENALV